jgi:hypothetical protein
MPINREKSIQVGSSITNSENDTLEDLADRIGITKSTYIRKAIKEMNCRLITEINNISEPMRGELQPPTLST